jgi:photosystem II stability/assembly factor-like uncharacterized protein
MKAKPLLFSFSLFAFFIFQFSFAYGQWQWQNPLPQGNTLNDVFFIDQNTGWTVGDAGTIMKSIDGGLNFDLINYPTHQNFSCVEFFNANTGLIAGSSGMILKTLDGGMNWSQVDAGITGNFTDMSIVNSSLVWLVSDDGTIIKSTDYGDSWQGSYIDEAMQFKSLSFVDEGHGWAAGYNDSYYSGMVRTSDGGNTWISLEPPFEFALLEICFTDTLIGYAYSNSGDYEDFLAKTTNGGDSWDIINDELYYGDFHDIFFTDSVHGWIAGSSNTIPGYYGILFFTDDGGINWYPGENLGWENLFDFNAVYFINNQTGWMVGSFGNTLYTFDGGEHWTRTNPGSNSNSSLKDVFFIDENDGWVVGGSLYPGVSMILHTPDGGNSWIVQVAPTDNILGSVYFTSPQEGWITTERSAGGWWSEILHTTNGGNTWEIQYSIDYDQGTFSDICFTDGFHGWAVGEVGHTYPPPLQSLIYHTWNGGDTWMDYSYLASNAISSVYFTDSQHGWMAGHKVILHTSSGGQTWEEIWTGPHFLQDIFFTDEQHGWAIGDSATRYPHRDVIMRTTDGGMTWEEQFPGFGSYKKSIFFTDNEHGWIARDEGDILYTVDGGITWDHMFLNTNYALGGIWFNDIDNGWVVGGYDAIFHIDNGSIVSVKEETPIQPSTFNLQHYPNPTSGIVDFRFSIFDFRWVTVRIYDVQGREVATVMEGRCSGDQVVRWDASSFPAGIYFYRLTTDDCRLTTCSGKILKH